MKKVLFILLSAVMISSCCTSNSGNIKLQKVSPESVGMCSERLQLADSVINQAIAKSEIPGAVLAVVRGDKIAYLKAYGNKQVYPDTVKMTENTIFDLASVSKCVGTTLSFLQLVENGKVRLTDPVEMYIPGFQQWVDPETGRKTSIRVQDLLSHSSGILPYINTASYLKKYGPATPDSLIKHIAQELPLKYKPTTGYTYSCLNFITLQNILQNVTGMKLYQYAQQNVFGALGLKHTSDLPLDAADRQEALSTVTPDFLSLVAPTEVENGKVILGEVHDPTARLVNMGNSGNAGVFSNAEDLAVIAAAILNKGEVKGRRVLSPLMVETMMTNPKTNDPSIERNLGWDTYTTGAGTKGDIFLTQPNTFVHTGYTGTSMLFDIDNNCCVILLTNRVHPSDAAGVVARTRGVVANIVAASIME